MAQAKPEQMTFFCGYMTRALICEQRQLACHLFYIQSPSQSNGYSIFAGKSLPGRDWVFFTLNVDDLKLVYES